MQSKRKSSWKILVVAAAANLLAVAAQAVPDAPHDAGNSIGCLTCHQMTSTYPKLLPPLGGTPLDMDDTYANRVCRSCHDGSGSTIVLTDTHSSLTMSNKYGDWTVECWVCHNEHLQEQNRYNGSTYGMYIRRNINLANIKKPDGTSLKTGTKSVVFTGPATFADGNAIYNGICEVCHTQTTHFRNDGSGSNQNHDGKQGSDCVSCHNHDTGFTGGAVHNTFITDDNKTGDPAVLCSGCHTNYAAAPETAHSACAACHTTAPTLLDSAFPTADGQVDDDGTSMFANLAAAGYTFNGTTGRLNDPDGTDIAGVGGNGVFALVKCGVCHAAKPDALAAVPAEHGGHPVTDWDYSTITNDCLDCHADGGLGTIQGVHSNTCTLCHVNPGAGDFARKIGDAANGVDGNALLASGRTGDCLTCHPGATYTKTKIHHDTANAVATPSNGCTTACHNTTTGHAGNHNTLVAIQNPPCQGCHNAAAASGGNNVPVDGTAGNLIHDYCTSCHSNPSNDLIATVTAPTAHATTMNNADGTTATNNGGGTCTACHTAYFDGHEHKTAHTMPTVAFCLNCHTATSVPYSDAGDVHAGSGCMTCHDAANGALKGSAVAATGGENCQGCHSGYFASHDHADTSTGTQSHSLQSVALCEGCHIPYAAGAAVSATIHDADGCFTCHNSGTGALQGSAASAAGTEDCQGCHTTYFDGHGHGGTTATPNHTQTLSKDALCGNCHGSSLSGPDAVTAPYASGSEAHFLDGCFTCHSPVNGSPIGSAANWGATWSARVSGTCVTCHTAGFAVHPHTHTFAADASCAICHGNPTPVTSDARDAVAAPFVGAGEVHAASGCTTCHDGATGALKGSATGQSGATGCISCHIGGGDTWTTVHTAALGTVQPAVDHTNRVGFYTACVNCHVIAGDSNARVATDTPFIGAGEVHATAGCITCHTGNNDGGFNAGPFAKADLIVTGGAVCYECHIATTSWKNRHTGANGLDHTTRVDGLAACITCHNATAGGPNGLMPVDATSGNKVHDDCYNCHNSTFGVNLGQLLAITATGGSANIARGDCGTCHSATYFNNHTHHYTANNQVVFSATVDRSQGADLAANACDQCHTDNTDGSGTPLNSFTDILGEHVTGCGRCHSYTDDGNGTPLEAEVAAAIATPTPTPVNCTTCHVKKLWSNASSLHGGHAPTHFGWAGNCQSCHGAGAGAEEVVKDIHGNTCDLCHTTGGPYNATTEKLGANGDGDARLANGAAAAATPFDPTVYTCTTCHNQAQVPGFHGITIAQVTSSHQLSSDSSGGYDCESCHSANIGNEQLSTHMPADTVANCTAICHGNTTPSATSGIVAKTVIDNVTWLDPAPNQNNSKCENCHAAKGDYRRHGLTDDASAADGIGDGTGGVVFHDNLGNSTGQAVSYTGKLAGAYGGLKVANYNCGDCHAADPNTKAISDLEAMQLHTSTNGTGYGNCLTCHVNAANVADEIAAGIGGTVQNCESCHSAANGNGPSGEAMYQYDGVRHHKTAHAQAGDCTWCHADPRPSTTTQAGAYGATADAVGTYNTGWNSDYSLGYGGTIPKQPACRLCHTNYGTDGAGTPWSVNVSGGNGNHGYNIAGYSGTATERTTGLTVYGNNFNAGLSGTTVSSTSATVNATRITQNTIHRIDANNGSSMIKVYDYGACFGCHSVQVMHAAPVPGADYPTATADIQTVPWDTLRYAPGRAVFNRLRGSNDNNQAWNNHRLQYQNGYRNIAGGSPTRGKSYYKNVGGTATDWYFNSQITHNTLAVPLNAAITNFQSQAGALAIYFTDIAAPAIPDYVQFLSAVWDGATVTVQARNDDGCAALSARTQPDGIQRIAPGSFTGTTICSGTFAIGSVSGVTLDIETTNGAGTDSTGNAITSLVAATAVDDNLASASTGGPYGLDVLANDTGTSLQVASVSAVTKTSGAGTCGTITNDTTSVGYTPGGGDAVCTFTYQAQAYDGATPFGAPSQATVTVTQAVNTPPTLNVTAPTNTTVNQGASVAVNFTLSDPDDAATVSFYYDQDGTPGNGDDVAIAGCSALGEAATTCNWDTTGVTAGGAVYNVFGSATGGTTVYTYAPGTVTVNDAPAADVTRIDANWTTTESTATTAARTITYTAPAGSNRMLVAVAQTEHSNTNCTISGITYGGQTMTIIAQGQNGTITGYNNCTAIAILKEAGIQAASNTNLTVTHVGSGGTINSLYSAATFRDVNQISAVLGNSANNALNTIATSVNNVNRGRVIYAVEFNHVTLDNTVSTGFTMRNQTATTSGTGFMMHIGEQTNAVAGTPVNISTSTATTSNRTTIATVSLPPL